MARRGLALVALASLFGCAMLAVTRADEQKTDAWFRENVPGQPVPRMRYLADGDGQLGYVATGNPEARPVLFIHGTPGRWTDFAHYLTDPKLSARARLLAIDRPGWGGSRSSTAGKVVRLAEQSALLAPLIEQASAPGCGVVLVGHSLGASLAARVAMDYPDAVAGLLIVAGTLDPKLGKPRWYNQVSSWWPLRWLMPEPLLQANREIRPLRDDLLDMRGRWRDLRMPVRIVQGGADRLVAPANADFARSVLPDAELVTPPTAGHFVLWEDEPLIATQLRALLERLPNCPTPPRQAAR